MGLITYILRAYIEESKYPIFNVCPMYFFTDIPDKFENLNTFVVENEFFTDKQKKVYMELFAIAQKPLISGSFLQIYKQGVFLFITTQTSIGNAHELLHQLHCIGAGASSPRAVST